MRCAHCERPIGTIGFSVRGGLICPDCHAAVNAEIAALEAALVDYRAAKVAALKAADVFAECERFWKELPK